MTDNHQSDHLDDELLSAYVDGELSGELLALVEQRLATDPLAGQLVEELRAMSQELQALPTEVIGEDLRATIMQRAERAMLLGTGLLGTGLLGTGLLGTGLSGAAEQVAAEGREKTSRRGWVWAAFALAAALLLTAYLPTAQQEEQPLASAKPAQGGEADEKNHEVPPVAAVAAEASDAEAVAEEEAIAEPESPAGQRFARSQQPMSLAEAAAQRSDPLRLTCLVHVTLSDKDSTGEQFAKRLVENGITFRAGENRQTRSRIVEAEPQEFAAVDQFGEKQRPATLESELQQLVLVEAPTERIENVLQGLNADTVNCAAVRVTEQQPAGQSIDHLRQWQRSDQQFAQSALHAQNRDALANTKAMQGWATRLDASQYQAGKLNVDRQRFDQQTAVSAAAPQPSIQVLFILQQAAGEPAAAREEAVPSR